MEMCIWLLMNAVMCMCADADNILTFPTQFEDTV